MAHSLQAKKRLRQSIKARARNQPRRTEARSAVRKARELIASGPKDEAQTAVNAAAAVLDRTARRSIIHRNNAARTKSRLMRHLNASGTPGAAAAAPKRRTRAATPRPSRSKK